MSEPVFTVDDDEIVEWIEVPRLEALVRLENMLTEDIVAFEIDAEIAQTPVGSVKSFMWLLVTDEDEQTPVIMTMKDSSNEGKARWFIHRDIYDG